METTMALSFHSPLRWRNLPKLWLLFQICVPCFCHEISHCPSNRSTSYVKKLLISTQTISIDLFKPLLNEESRTSISECLALLALDSIYLVAFLVARPLLFFVCMGYQWMTFLVLLWISHVSKLLICLMYFSNVLNIFQSFYQDAPFWRNCK